MSYADLTAIVISLSHLKKSITALPVITVAAGFQVPVLILKVDAGWHKHVRAVEEVLR